MGNKSTTWLPACPDHARSTRPGTIIIIVCSGMRSLLESAMRGSGRFPLIILFLVVFSAAGPLDAQVLRGRVIDQEAGSPIPVASVKLIEMHSGLALSSLTNEAGLFRFQVESEGPFILDIFALGYLPHVDTLRVPPIEEEISIEVRLGVDALPLEPLVVTASRSPWWEVTKPRMLWAYHERKDLQEKLGLGRFYDRDDLKMQFAAGPLSLLVEMWPPRAENLSVSLSDRPCEYRYYVDGLKWSGTLQEIPYRTSDLYSVEIYRGPSETPGEFLNSDSRCGVMVFWTFRNAEIG